MCLLGVGMRELRFLAIPVAWRAGSLPCGKGAGRATWRRVTVVAPAGAVGVGDPLAAERLLALLRCRPWLLAVPVRAQQLSLASFCCRAEPPLWRFFRPGKRPVVSYNCLLTGTATNGPA